MFCHCQWTNSDICCIRKIISIHFSFKYMAIELQNSRNLHHPHWRPNTKWSICCFVYFLYSILFTTFRFRFFVTNTNDKAFILFIIYYKLTLSINVKDTLLLNLNMLCNFWPELFTSYFLTILKQWILLAKIHAELPNIVKHFLQKSVALKFGFVSIHYVETVKSLDCNLYVLLHTLCMCWIFSV